VKRVRLRGDWSDTGPNARPERESTPPASTPAATEPTTEGQTEENQAESAEGGQAEQNEEGGEPDPEEGASGNLMQRMTEALSRMLNDPGTRAAMQRLNDNRDRIQREAEDQEEERGDADGQEEEAQVAVQAAPEEESLDQSGKGDAGEQEESQVVKGEEGDETVVEESEEESRAIQEEQVKEIPVVEPDEETQALEDETVEECSVETAQSQEVNGSSDDDHDQSNERGLSESDVHAWIGRECAEEMQVERTDVIHEVDQADAAQIDSIQESIENIREEFMER